MNWNRSKQFSTCSAADMDDDDDDDMGFDMLVDAGVDKAVDDNAKAVRRLLDDVVLIAVSPSSYDWSDIIFT